MSNVRVNVRQSGLASCEGVRFSDTGYKMFCFRYLHKRVNSSSGGDISSRANIRRDAAQLPSVVRSAGGFLASTSKTCIELKKKAVYHLWVMLLS